MTRWVVCFNGFDQGISVNWAVWVLPWAGWFWVYQLPREFESFNGLAGLCISVYCVRLGVLWRFSRMHGCYGCFNCLSGTHVYILLIMYTWHLNQQFPRILIPHLHNKNAPQCEPAFCNPVQVVNTLETEGPRVRASPASLRCCPWARHIYPSLVLVQPR